MAKAEDSKTRRTAIRVVVFLGVLVALTCLGAVTFFQAAFGDLESSLIAWDTHVADQLPEGATWQLAELSAAADGAAPTDGIHLVLVVGMPDHEPSLPRDAELRADAWNAYCDAFETGGIDVRSVAIGRADDVIEHEFLRCCGDVTTWEDDLEDVPSLVGRTGRAAPPNVAVVDWFGNGVRLTHER